MNENEEDYLSDYQPKMYVLVNGEKIYNDDPNIKIFNIEEDMYGRDVVTFEYKNETHKSLVFLK